MKVYLAILSVQYRMLLQYRAAAVAGFGTQLFWGLIRVTIFTAFYESSVRVQPMRQDEVITYLWLLQALFALTFWSYDLEVRQMIRDGTVAYELLRPLDLYWLWFSRAIASRVAPTTLRSVPLFVFAGLFFGLKMPPSVECAVSFALALAGATLLIAACSTLLTITLIHTVAGDGVARLAPALTFIFSGMALPIPLMPDWLQRVCNILPFRDMCDSPLRLYMGHIPPQQLWQTLAHEAAWTLGLILVGREALRRAMSRLVAQGG
jgi:ABC-2 type transport system permease protein